MATSSEVVGFNGAPSFKKGVRAEVQVIDVQYLIDLVPKIPKDVQEQFEKEYGRLIDLILITVNTEALKAMSAMIQYWNPTLRVFEFPNLDASPTIEEYEVLLDIGKSGRLKVYQFTDHQNVTEKKELLQANQIRLLEAKLEEARNEIEKYGFSVEKLDKIIETQKKEHTSLKRDYASICSTSEKYHLIRTRKEKDKKIVELIKMNEEKDEQISNMSHQLKARGRALHSAQKDIHVLEAKAESLQALAQDTKNEESHAWATMKEYQAALEKTLEREDQLKTIMKEMEKAHHQALAEANNDKVYLSEQLSLLEATHDELVTRQQEWLHNWDHMLQECKWDKDRWEERCRKIIDGLGNFANDWLRNFEDARGELQMYPETELRPAMRAFYETCDQLAWKLRKWRIAATRDF
ncbi:hypothetical protein Lal_00031307 [Lupinus albus]|nr:hypothetical protein Lal_00031307 [Lupinus albus]